MQPANSPEHSMRRALDLAAKAIEDGEVPIAAVIELDGEEIVSATTERGHT